MTSTRITIRIGLFVNALLLLFITLPIILLNDGSSTYLRWGWYDDFILISVPINTRNRYIWVNVFIILIKTVDVLVTELVQPKISYPIYNPDKKVIHEFTKNELHFYGNTLFRVLRNEGFGFKEIQKNETYGNIGGLYGINLKKNDKVIIKIKNLDKISSNNIIVNVCLITYC